VTDVRDNLLPLLESLAEAGVRRVSAGYLFLREGIQENMRPALDELGVTNEVLGAYAGGPILSAPGIAPARYLPKARRQRGYATLMSLAAPLGIEVGISSAINPDFLGSPPVSRKPFDDWRPLSTRFSASGNLFCPA
jgi:hypothetical protein